MVLPSLSVCYLSYLSKRDVKLLPKLWAVLIITRFRFQDAAFSLRTRQHRGFYVHSLTLWGVTKSLQTLGLIDTHDQRFAACIVRQSNFYLRRIRRIFIEVCRPCPQVAVALSGFQILLRCVEDSAIRRNGFVRRSRRNGPRSRRG